MDAGLPISYEVLPEGTPVVASDGRQIGHVKRVLALFDEDIFHGLILTTAKGERFVDAESVASIHERAVNLALDVSQADELPEPTPGPAAMAADPADTGKLSASERARRVWNVISGKY